MATAAACLVVLPGLAQGDESGRTDAETPIRGSDEDRELADAAAEPWELPVSSSDEPVRFVPQLQVRLRYRHHEGHEFAPGGVTDNFRHRVRLGLAATYADRLGALVQLQDVRTFGEEQDPLGDYEADGFDLHQAYARLMPSESLEFRLGRQEIVIANSRLLGNVDFAEQARAFDAFRVIHEADHTRLEAAYALVRDYPGGAGPGGSLLPDGKRHLGLFHLGHELMGELHPHVVAVAEGDTTTELTAITAGALIDGRIGRGVRLDYTIEGYYQFGKEGAPTGSRAGAPMRYDAFLIATRARATAERSLEPYMEVITAFISGDDNPNDRTIKTFRSPYPTGHKFHGEMDLFLDFPRDTQLRGLVDLGAALGVGKAPITGRASFHLFDGLARRGDTMRYFGYELDFKAKWEFWEHASIDALYALFVPGELVKAGRDDADVEHFAYSTMNVQF
ncbi:MAG: alginate export family protein [Deltaproteobacteria bacterium]|nr:alginate export family protein [Deltaproteobacteria bacterium]